MIIVNNFFLGDKLGLNTLFLAQRGRKIRKKKQIRFIKKFQLLWKITLKRRKIPEVFPIASSVRMFMTLWTTFLCRGKKRFLLCCWCLDLKKLIFSFSWGIWKIIPISIFFILDGNWFFYVLYLWLSRDEVHFLMRSLERIQNSPSGAYL